MQVEVVEDAAALAHAAATRIAGLLAARPSAAVLAATGDTPMGCYAELARRRRAGELDTSRMRLVQLDEYLGIGPGDRRSLLGWMRSCVGEPLGIGPERTVELDGLAPDPQRACRDYEARVAAAGGIDLALLGLGPNGHLGFNEPPSERDAPTRVVELSAESLASNARYWGDDVVPGRALTAGMSVILGARRVLLLVSGSHKANILARLLATGGDPDLPASWLHRHPATHLIADRAAAGEARAAGEGAA